MYLHWFIGMGGCVPPAGVRALARPCHRSQYAAPILEHNEGVIINIGSLQTLMSEVNAEAYSAGVVALTHASAVSLGPKARVMHQCQWDRCRTVEKTAESQLPRPVLTLEDHHQHTVARVGTPLGVVGRVA